MNFTRDFGDGVGGITPVLRARRILVRIACAAIGFVLGLTLLAAAAFCGAVIWSKLAHARDDGQWGDSPANIRQWFQSLMQPDNPYLSCCGEADAFEADNFAVDGDHYVAIITDGKGVIPPGTRIAVPNAKMKWDRGNPTGHGIIFIGNQGQVYCYVAPGGV